MRKLLYLAVLLLMPAVASSQVLAIIGDSTTASITSEPAFAGNARLASHANFIYVADANREVDSMWMWSWDGSGTLGLALYKIADAGTTMVGTEQTLDPGSSTHQLWGIDVSPNISLTAGDSLAICIGNQTAALGSGVYTLTAGVSYDATTGALPDPYVHTATVNTAYIVYATVVASGAAETAPQVIMIGNIDDVIVPDALAGVMFDHPEAEIEFCASP